MKCEVCKKRSQEGGSFHRFPSDKNTREIWIQFVNKNGRNQWTPKKHSVICSRHFQVQCFEQVWDKVLLKKGSIPTLENSLEILLPLKHIHKLDSEMKTSPEQSFPDTGVEVISESEIIISSELESMSSPNVIPMSPLEEAMPVSPVDEAMADSPVEEAMPMTPVEETTPMSLVEEANIVDMTNDDILCERQTAMTGNVTHFADIAPLPDIMPEGSTKHQSFIASAFSHDHRYEDTPRSLRKKFHNTRRKLFLERKRSKGYKEKCQRKTKKISYLKDIISSLKKKRSLPEDAFYNLEHLGNTPLELFKRINKNMCGITREKYPPELRCFALTVHFYSPKVYSYIRRKFKLALPHPNVLRSWYSSVEGKPGFTEESFNSLKLKVSAAHAQGKELVCSLIKDDMGIKKGFKRTKDGKVRGHVDLGLATEPGDYLLEAKNVIVFMVVPLHSNWKLPIGYFLISSLTAETEANLVREALVKLHEVGVKICPLTMDGPANHFSMVSLLGAKMSVGKSEPQPSFPHPIKGEPDINVFFDPCHMLKNIRNCLEDYQVLIDSDGGKIEWRFIQELQFLQQSEGLKLGNKLQKRHIEFKKSIMKVFLAAQTLSSSVASSIAFCWDTLRLPQFQGCEATVRFIKCIDTIFDFLNVRNPWGKGSKASLSTKNEELLQSRMLVELEYLKGIQTSSGTSIFFSKRKAGDV